MIKLIVLTVLIFTSSFSFGQVYTDIFGNTVGSVVEGVSVGVGELGGQQF